MVINEQVNILIVDDNPGNLLVLEGLLETLDCNIITAVSGNDALGLMLEYDFALVLLDVQMPEMDGFEATAEIRKREQVTGAHLPIVAMTAHAMKGDRERCLAAGMDAYVTKPIRFKELFATIESFIAPLANGDARAPMEIAVPESAPVFDLAAALERTEGDRELLIELTKLFESERPRLAGEIRDAVARRDARALESAAHALKGSLANLAAIAASNAAQELENIGRSGDLEPADSACAALEKELDRLYPKLQKLAAEVIS